MPTYRVTDPISGQTLRLTGDSPPAEQELNEIFSKVSPQNSQQPTPQQPQTPLEQRISQRPDIYNQATQTIQNLMQQPQTNPFNPIAKLNSMGQVANLGLQTFGGIAQRGEAAIANPFLKKQGQFQNPITAFKQGITGEQLGELGDVARQAGIPEPISAGLGLVGTGIIGGALARVAGITQKANNLMKLESTYGKDFAKMAIRQTTELPMPLVERGMERGWRRILTKANAQETDLPTKISSYVMNSLDDITQNEYDEFGKVIDKLKTGNVKAIDLNQKIQDRLLREGYLDQSFNSTLKMRGSVVNKIFDFIDNAVKSKIKPDDNIPIMMIKSLKDKIKSFIPEKNLIGKIRSLKGEQGLAKRMMQDLDELVSYNAYGIEDESYAQARRRYSDFKNFEQAILNTFSEIVGQKVTPTADKVVGISKLHPTKMLEEMNKLYNIDDFFKSKGYQPIADRLLDWMTTQETLIKPGGISLNPAKTFETAIKYLMRQYLSSGGNRIGNTGQVVNKSNLIPAFVLKIIQQQNQSKFQGK